MLNSKKNGFIPNMLGRKSCFLVTCDSLMLPPSCAWASDLQVTYLHRTPALGGPQMSSFCVFPQGIRTCFPTHTCVTMCRVSLTRVAHLSFSVQFLLGFYIYTWLTESLSLRLNSISPPLSRGYAKNSNLSSGLILLVCPTPTQSHLINGNSRSPPQITDTPITGEIPRI